MRDDRLNVGGAVDAIRDIWRAVLGGAEISDFDNFFSMGGNSLQAARVVAQVRRLGVDVTLSDLIASSTLAEFAERISIAESVSPDDEPEPRILPRDEPLRPSLAQERYYELHSDPRLPQFAPALMHVAFRIRGKLDVSRLDDAIRLVMLRHEALRSGLQRSQFLVWQPSASELRAPLTVMRLDRAPVDDADEAVRRVIRQELTRAFDREVPPLFRIRVVEISDEDRVLVLVMDHLIGDGWSLRVLMSDLSAAYRALGHDPEFQLAPLDFQFADWAQWQRRLLTDTRLETVSRYWRTVFGNQFDVLATRLPGHVTVPPNAGFVVSTTFGTERASAWHRCARRHKATLYSLILAAVARVIAEDVGSGPRWFTTSVANRGPAWTAPIVGPLSHMTYLGVDVRDRATLVDVLTTASAAVARLDTYGIIPNNLLREMLWPDRYVELPGLPMLYIVVNPPWVHDFTLSGARVSVFPSRIASPGNGLEFWVTDFGDAIEVALCARQHSLRDDYLAELLARTTAEVDRMAFEPGRTPA